MNLPLKKWWLGKATFLFRKAFFQVFSLLGGWYIYMIHMFPTHPHPGSHNAICPDEKIEENWFKKKRPKEKNTNPLKLCKLAFIQLPPPRAKKAANFISGSRWEPGNFWSAHDFFPTAFGKQKPPKKNQAEWPSRSMYDSIPKVKSIPGLFREDIFEGDGIEGGQISSHVFLLPQFFRSSFSPQKNVPSGPKNSNRTCRVGKISQCFRSSPGNFPGFFWRGGPWETHLSPPNFSEASLLRKLAFLNGGTS